MLTVYSSLGVPIGNAVLIAALHTYVPALAPSVSANAVVIAGPLDLTYLTTLETVLQGLREAWARAVSRVNVFLLVVICVSVPTACGMEWLNIKRISREREEERTAKKQNEASIESREGKETKPGENENKKVTENDSMVA